MNQHSNYRGPRIRREKEKVLENIEEIIIENFPNMGKEILKSRKHGESHTG